jgi:hypothetical protein
MRWPVNEPGAGLGQQSAPERRQLDCVEIYLPKSIEFLSELYQYLREKVTHGLSHPLVLDGFSIYEVDGVFRGEVLWEQRTLVIRLLFPRPEKHAALLEAMINDLGSQIARIAAEEEQIWISHYPQELRVFRGLRRLLT